MTIKKSLTVISLIVAFIGSLYLISKYNLTSNLVPPTPEMRDPGVNMVLKGVRILEKRGDKILSDIHASKTIINDKKKMMTLLEVDSILYNSEQPTIRLKSDLGYMDQKTNDLQLVGNVVVISEDGGTLVTDRLYWDADKKIFTTKSKVKIRGKGFNLVGKEMESSLTPKDLKFDKGVHAVFY